MAKVRRPYERIKESVVNQSSRNGVKPRLIVLHSTESHDRPGTQDLEGVVGWFDNPAAQASSHVVVDSEGYSAQAVPDERKAWTQAQYNSQSLSIEQIGFAASGWTWWFRRKKQLKKVAKYIAYWSNKYDIPIQRANTSYGIVTGPGVATHRQLGAAGGGHHDPGSYPFKYVLAKARYYKRFGW